MLSKRETKDVSPWATNTSAKLLQVPHKSQSPPGRHPSLRAFPPPPPKNLTLGIPPTLVQHLLPHRSLSALRGWGWDGGGSLERTQTWEINIFLGNLQIVLESAGLMSRPQ